MSISKSQAAALAEGFLNNIGSENEGLQPRKTITELFLLAGELIESAQKNLNATNSNASGKLSKSLELNNPKQSNGTVSVDVLMSFYGQFLDAGVKGTKSGHGKYRFKSSFPSRKMVEALRKSIGRAWRSTTNVNRSKSISANEIKNSNISAIAKAYGAGRNIKMYGIKATNFMDKAIITTASKVSERLGNAFEVDILNSI